MSSFEQKIEVPDKNVQYLLFACDPYETIAFKVSWSYVYFAVKMTLKIYLS